MKQTKRDRITEGFPRQQMIVLPGPVVKNALAKPVTAGLLPTDIGLFPSAFSHFVRREVGVSQAILICCVRGEGWAEIDGGRCVVREGEVLIVPPNRPHSYGAAEHRPWTIYWCHVAGSSVPSLLEVLGVQKGGPAVIPGDARLLVPLFEKIIVTLAAGYSRPSLLTASLVLGHLFSELIARRGTGPTRDDVNERLELTIDFMRQQVGGQVRLSELAAMARLSPSHFAMLFKRKTGYAVLDYFIRLKTQEACRLLDLTALPIKAVAGQLGYDDALYFSRVFHRVMALSPRAYRALHKG